MIYSAKHYVEEKDKVVTMERKIKDTRLLYTNADGMLSKKSELLDLVKGKQR